MITVVVPLFNDEAYIDSCLNSILSQSVEDIEVIVVDDGSTDSSQDIVKKKIDQDCRVRLISQKNSGMSAARNTGIENARGDYIMFVDSDDELYSNNSIELLLNELQASGADAAIGSIKVQYEANQEYQDSDNWYYKIKYSSAQLAEASVIQNFHASSCAALFKMSVINGRQLRYPIGLHYEDAYWHWVYFTSCKKIAFTPEYVYRYYRRQSSIMASTFSGNRIAIDHVFIAERIFDFWNENHMWGQYKGAVKQILEDYFYFSFRYLPEWEKVRAVYECARIIRKYEIDVSDSTTLRNISEGKIAFLFPDQKVDSREYARYQQIKNKLNKLLPDGSCRRRLAYQFARKLWSIIK